MELSNEEKLVVGYYALFGTYTETSRRTGLSIDKVKTIVNSNSNSEILEKKKEDLKKPLSFANPLFTATHSTATYEEQLKKLLDEVMLYGNVL